MAIINYSVEELVRDFSARGKKPSGRLLTLSRYMIGCNAQYLNSVFSKYGWDNRLDYDGLYIDDMQLFSALGFESLEAMDYSDYEGADFIYDLNSSDIPAGYLERYDYIIDGGTLEHVFNLPNALKAVFQMLKIGGTFFFDQPVFFGINHGFYNISPCLYYEYFLVNRWKANSYRLYMNLNRQWEGQWIDMNISELDMRHGDIAIKQDSYCNMWGSVTKTTDTTCTVAPQQPIYSDQWEIERNSNEKVNRAIEAVSNGNVYLYGTGQHTKNIIMSLSLDKRNKLEAGGVISISPDEIGRRFMYDVKIHDVSAVKSGDTVIISSKIYQDIIYERIQHLTDEGITIVKLY